MSPIKAITHIPQFHKIRKQLQGLAVGGKNMKSVNVGHCINGTRKADQEIALQGVIAKHRKKPATLKQKRAWKKMAISISKREKIDASRNDDILKKKKIVNKFIHCATCKNMVQSMRILEHKKNCDEFGDKSNRMLPVYSLYISLTSVIALNRSYNLELNQKLSVYDTTPILID